MSNKDMFGIDIEVDDYVIHQAMYGGGHSYNVGKVKRIKGDNTIEVITALSTYDYYVGNHNTLINVNDKLHMLENSSEIIATLEENDLKITDRALQAQQRKDMVKDKKNKLKREMKPGDKFQGGGYGRNFIYLGVENKRHIFAEFNRAYSYRRQPGDPDYEFSTTKSKFYQDMKTKKTPTEKFDTVIDVEAMLKHLEKEIRERSRYCSVEQDDIDKVRALYNNIV